MVKSSSTGTAVWGYAADGSTETTYVTGTINLLVAGWNNLTNCFTTPASVSASAYFFIKADRRRGTHALH